MGSDTLTPFVESNMLLAVIGGDYPEARRLARTMSRVERTNLWGSLDTMQSMLERVDSVPDIIEAAEANDA